MAARNKAWTPEKVRQRVIGGAVTEGRWFVYVITQDDVVIYVGKGSGTRHLVSQRRLGGTVNIVRRFKKETAALRHEKALIAKYTPQCNRTNGGEGRSKRRRQPSDSAIARQWARDAYAREHSGYWLDALMAQCYRKCEENMARANG